MRLAKARLSVAFVFAISLARITCLAQDAKVIVTNADAIVAALPDTKLAEDVFESLDDRELKTLAFFESAHDVDAKDYAMLLIELGAPESVTRIQFNGRVFTLSPVADFEEFVKAIDYGKVVAEDAASRTVKVEIDLAEFEPDKLRKRGERSEVDSRRVGRILGTEQEELNEGRFDRFAGRNFDEEEPAATDQLGANFEEGDHVEVDLGGKPTYGVVRKTKAGRHDRPSIQVVLSNYDELAKRIRKRSIRTRLERADEFVFWAPPQRLRKLAGPPAQPLKERTWTDTTGKFEVEATFAGRDGDRIRLKRANGKVSNVPLAKLCDADRQYVKNLQGTAGEQVALTQGVGGSLRADWSGIKTIRPRVSRKWNWTPPVIPSQPTARTSVTTLDVSAIPSDSAFSEDMEQLFVARDGQSAVVLLTSGHVHDERSYLQRLDFATGETAPIVECPPNSVVLDVLPEEQLVLLRNNEIGVTSNLRLYLRRIEENDLQPVSDFNASPPKAFHKGITGARLLSGNRLLAHGFAGNWIVWDGATAKALYHLDVGHGTAEIAIGPQGRFLFVEADSAVVVIDTETGDHVASVPHGNVIVKRLSVDRQMKRLAIATGDSIYTIDLTSGKLIDGFSGGIVRKGEVDFINDLLLVDNRFLVAPKYPLILWQYVMATSGSYDTHATVRGGRLWYAARHGGGIGGTWAVASVPTPHDAIDRTLKELGDLDDLVILALGDQVTVSADTDLDADTEKQLLDSTIKAFETAGFEVIDAEAADATTKEAIVTCKKSDKPVEVMIANPNKEKPQDNPTAFKPPKGFAIPRMSPPGFVGRLSPNWMYEPHTLTPYNSTISIRLGGQVLWEDGYEIYDGQQFSPVADGTVQQVIERLTSPSIERLARVELPGQMCKLGPVGGAYGASLLDGDGIKEDYLGEEEE